MKLQEAITQIEFYLKHSPPDGKDRLAIIRLLTHAKRTDQIVNASEYMEGNDVWHDLIREVNDL